MGKHRDDAADAGERRFFHGVRQTVEMPENVENLTNYCFLIELKSQTHP